MEEEIITPEEPVFDYEKLRYILNKDGYVCHASLGGLIVCDLGECTEYTGEVPKGYETIYEWYDKEIEKLNAWKIVDGNLVFDENKYNEIQKRCEKEAEENTLATHGWVNGRINKTSNVVKSELSKVASDSELLLINDSGNFEIPYLQVSSRGKLKEATGSNIHLSDSRGADLVDFKLYGKSTQETRSGKNIITGLRSSSNTYINYNIDTSKLTNQMTYSFIAPFDATSAVVYIRTASTTGIYSKGKINIVSNQKTSFTFELTDDEIQVLQNENSFIQLYKDGAQWGTPTLEEPQLENGATTTEYEIYGAMPSPYYPSEIKSVGYKNLFDKDSATYKNNYLKNNEGAESSTSISGYLTSYIPIEPYEKYTIQGTLKVINDANSLWRLYFYDKDKNWIKRTNAISQNPPYTFTAPENAYFMQFQYIISVFDADTIQIEKGTIAHPHIPFGKYGVEVETIGKNLFNNNLFSNTTKNGVTWTIQDDGGVNLKGSNTSTSNVSNSAGTWASTKPLIKLDADKTYTLSFSGNFDNEKVQFECRGLKNGVATTITSTISKSTTITGFTAITLLNFYAKTGATDMDETVYLLIEVSELVTEYEPYKLTQTLIQSDYPLMSNKDESVKDYVYLQNGNLYLKKYINEIVLNGSENWQDRPNYTYADRFILNGIFPNNHKKVLSDYFEFSPSLQDVFPIATNNSGQIVINFSAKGTTTKEQFKTWLSENNVKVQYELAEPEDILIAENVDSLITYKNVTNISTNDDLQPNMGVTYYADIDENIPVNIKISNKNLLGNKLVSTTIKGIEFNVNEDKTITLNGTATGDVELFIDGSSTSTEMLFLIKQDLQYVKSGLTDNVSLKLYNYDGTDRTLIDSGSNGNINLTASTIVTGASLFIASGTKFKKVTIAPMIEISDVETEYIEHEEVLKTGSFTSDNYTLIYENEPKTYEPATVIMIDEFADIEANYFNGKIIERQQAEIEVLGDEIKTSVTSIEEAIGTIEEAINVINTTMLTQTADQFEMLFKQTGIKELVDTIDNIAKSNNATLIEQKQWIRFKNGNIELGKSDSQVKLLLSNDRISFMTGGNESAYISNNQLYITDSTILNKLQVGHWETKEDEDGNLNTRWIGGVI